MTKQLYHFVLDCSITMAWCFEDESTDKTDAFLESLNHATAIVPTIWPLEVANVLRLSKRKNRITEVQAANFIDALASLPIVVDQSTSSKAMHSIFTIAGETGLTIYNAAYLELAMREKIPLLTLDKPLIKAAHQMSIPTHI